MQFNNILIISTCMTTKVVERKQLPVIGHKMKKNLRALSAHQIYPISCPRQEGLAVICIFLLKTQNSFSMEQI